MGVLSSLKKLLGVSPTWLSIGSLPGRPGLDKEKSLFWQDPDSEARRLLGKLEVFRLLGNETGVRETIRRLEELKPSVNDQTLFPQIEKEIKEIKI